MSLGENIKFYRKLAKLTQKDLADRAQMSRSYLADLERDRYNPSLETLNQIAHSLDIDVTDLIVKKPSSNVVSETTSQYSSSLTEKDNRDIAKRLEEIKRDIEHSDGLAFDGEPMSDEAMESFLDAMEFVITQTKRINKKYTPKKYRKKDNTD